MDSSETFGLSSDIPVTFNYLENRSFESINTAEANGENYYNTLGKKNLVKKGKKNRFMES